MCRKESSIVLIILFFLTSSCELSNWLSATVVNGKIEFVGVKSYMQGLRQEEEEGGQLGHFALGPTFLGHPVLAKLYGYLTESY